MTNYDKNGHGNDQAKIHEVYMYLCERNVSVDKKP